MDEFRAGLRDLRPGLLLALIAIVLSLVLGGIFGGAESSMRGVLAARAEPVRETVYHSDAARMTQVQDRAWTLLRRSHLHAGGMGTTALVLCVFLVLVPGSRWIRRSAGTALGAGSLGYCLFLLLAGFAAPRLGDANAAKLAYAWLAVPSAGAFILGTLGTIIVLLPEMRRPPAPRIVVRAAIVPPPSRSAEMVPSRAT